MTWPPDSSTSRAHRMPGPQMRRMLEVGIAHLPQHRLRNPTAFPGMVIYAAYGASQVILWVPDDPDRWATAEPVPDEVLVIQRYARRHGCDYVLFDPNGPPVEGLPRWS